jgi:hypothetical protein
MAKGVVISFFDYTGVMVEPWAKAGYQCFILDIQHEDRCIKALYADPDRPDRLGGSITALKWDASVGLPGTLLALSNHDIDLSDIHMVFGFPPCTDLAASGARHWEKKREADPEFQSKAAKMAYLVEDFALTIPAPYMIENPRGALSKYMGRASFEFDPCDYGGYLPINDKHPLWPEYIPPNDAYTKKTCIWAGNGFVHPEKRRVDPVLITVTRKNGSTTTGSATPRGVALATFYANTQGGRTSEVTLYRLEHPKDARKGPWASRRSRGAEKYQSQHHKHNPSDGPGWTDDRIRPPQSTRERYFTFVRSIDELKWWFRPVHLRLLNG